MSESDARIKLVRVLGEGRAAQLISEVLHERGLAGLESPTDRYVFATALIDRGGVLEAIGRAMRVQALLQGASGADAKA